jgi:hypothetical protein
MWFLVCGHQRDYATELASLHGRASSGLLEPPRRFPLPRLSRLRYRRGRLIVPKRSEIGPSGGRFGAVGLNIRRAQLRLDA